ncbi:MAG: nuclear transport factor 2 family protein [Spirulinaceae cyanobacterium]
MKSATQDTGKQAFEYFSQGLATQQWDAFLEMLADDFTFWFPAGPFQGLNTGKAKAREFCQYVAACFPDGLSVTLDGITSNETTVVFELRSEGKFRGEIYKNRVAVFFDVRGDKICSYREYFGSDGKSN